MYSGRAAYNSGVKHHGKMPLITMSVTLPSAWAMIRQPSTTAARKGSVAGQALCNDRDLTRAGYLAASHIAVAAPSDRPDTWAWSKPAACMNAAMSAANSSLV